MSVKSLKALIMISLSCLLLESEGTFFVNPCRMMPFNTPTSPGGVSDFTAPFSCLNGSFYWSYPKGHVRLHFTIPPGRELFVCFSDAASFGDIFALYDVTDLVAKPMGHVQKYSPNQQYRALKCTPIYTKDIVVRLDAPNTKYLMGEIFFKIGLPI